MDGEAALSCKPTLQEEKVPTRTFLVHSSHLWPSPDCTASLLLRSSASSPGSWTGHSINHSALCPLQPHPTLIKSHSGLDLPTPPPGPSPRPTTQLLPASPRQKGTEMTNGAPLSMTTKRRLLSC